ncbi:MAG: hypothetical protein ACRCZ2_11070 [Fusobacteriaceae bacterium]
MNLYFQFYNEEKTEYIKVDNNTSSIKTNLETFNLKVFELESDVDLRGVTNTTLMLEKENKGVFYHYKAINGEYDAYEKTFNFKEVKLSAESLSEKFRVSIDFKENGIVIYNTKEEAKEIYFKPEADEFDIDVHEAKRVSDVFELQSETDESITFTISVKSETLSTTAQHRWWFDYNESSVSLKEFEPLGSSKKTIVCSKDSIQFYENQTYIHVEVKDVFGNVRNKKFKILAPGNTYSLFEIFNEPVIINGFDTPIKMFLDYRNCDSIRPIIKYVVDKTTRETTSDKIFGEVFYEDNTFEFKLSEVFSGEVLSLAQKFYISMKLNESDSRSNSVEIIVDDKKPIIKLSNLDEDNYLLVVDEKDKEQVNGMIFDESLFFIGSESRKCTLEGVTDKLFIYSEKSLTNVEYANGEKPFLYNYGKYYICEEKYGDFELYDVDGIVSKDHYECLRHFHSLDKKHFYMVLDKNKLTNYERNIIDNQGGLEIKGPITEFVSMQGFVAFADFYFIEVEVELSNVEKYPFTVGIKDFDYDFSKYFYDSNVSCKLTQYKELDMDFDSTRIVFLALKKETELILFNNEKKLKRTKTYTADEISFCAISCKKDEFFTTTESVTFIDQVLNTLPFEKIHLTPVVTDELGNKVDILNFSMTEITNTEDKSYNISLEVPIKSGENIYNMAISDVTGQQDIASFIIEKNTELVRFEIQESEMMDSEIFKNEDDSISLVNNKDTCFVKVLIFNETRKEKNSERFLIVNNGKKTEKHRVQTKNGSRFVALYLKNSTKGEIYSLSYNDFSDELLKINTKQQNELFLKVEDSFISGANYYHLNYTKDEFSTVSVEYTNRQNFKCELHKEYIEITRIKNSNFIEDLVVTITVNDKNGNYSHVSRAIKGKFYNETVISDYFIENANNNQGKLDEPMFDLVIKSQEHEHVQYMTVYDEAELNVYKRKKTAYYDSTTESYRFSKITSPITPTSIKVNIQLKGEEALLLEKELFYSEMLYYSKNKNKVLTSVSKSADEVFIEMYASEEDEVFSEFEVYVNDNLFVKKEDVLISLETPLFEKINILDLPITSVLYCKFVNKKGMVSYSKIFNLDFNVIVLENNISHNFDKKLVKVSDANKLYMSNSERNEVELSAVNSLGEKSSVKLHKGDQIIDLFKKGEIYKVKLSIRDKNAYKTFYQNTIQVYEELSEIIELKNRFFEKIKYNKEVIIKNESLIESPDLNCFLSHYINGSLVKSYPPVFSGNEIKFNITKQKGLNKLIFNYNNEKSEVSTFEHKVELVKERKIHNIEISDNMLYAKNENEFILNGVSDVTLKTKGIKYLKINSTAVGRTTEKSVADNFTCKIRKSWLPCTIDAFDEDRNKIDIPSVSFKVIMSNKFSYNLKSNKAKNKTSILFRIGSSKPKITRNSFSFKLGYYNFHKMYSFANAYAVYTSNLEWLKLEKIERNNIIKKITSGCLDETENKKIIKEYIGGK